MKPKIAGIVVAGGLSTRMGRDKASLPWNGGTMLSTVLEKLNPVCSELIVVSNVHREINYLPVVIVPDKYPQCGPLAGIHAGLLATDCEYAFVAACDMPYLSTQAAGFIMEAALAYDAAIPFIDGYYHPLHGVYRKSCIPFIEQRLRDGLYRVTDFFNDIKVRKISREEITFFDPSLLTLRNINSPEDIK
jgi:molybdopterin-guanine dinucleotide biosynthesis protein A